MALTAVVEETVGERVAQAAMRVVVGVREGMAGVEAWMADREKTVSRKGGSHQHPAP